MKFRDLILGLVSISIGMIFAFILSINTDTTRATAQTIASNYVWTDSATVNTTGFDSTFVTRWNQTVIKVVGGNAYAKFGAPDTASWSSRNWYYIGSGESVSFGPATKLKRLELKAASGTVQFYQIGYKSSLQY